MSLSRRQLLKRAAAFGAAPALLPAGAAASGPFAADWHSLARHYRVPEWFRDAKFGIWAHWSAQCVPEFGDWYARLMYMQGTPAYEHHLKHYGHPSKHGFMEIDHLWRADRWEPEKLIERYSRAGAKYFMALACHHDNFDCYDSAWHRWNSVRVGPKRDIVGTWAKIVREQGLRFGVSNHAAHAWHWFQVAYGYDAEGPLAGVRYDAYHLRKKDGKGTWWEGLDPQDLYTGRHMVIPDGITSIDDMNQWHADHDGQWLETPPPHDPAFARNWLLRCNDLVDKYRPDLVYFDDTGLPLGQAGLDATAHFYNANMRRHRGRLEAVVTGKKLTPFQRRGIVEDVERGFADDIRPHPWQTDTCIGNWHYDRALYERHGYKTAENVVQRLCDVVSKNGNLMLSIPVRGNGALDDDEYAFLDELTRWMDANGEAIFGSRPWQVYGEGPTPVPAGTLDEAKAQPFTSQDIRFTRKGEFLYAAVLGRPTGEGVVIRTPLVEPTGEVERVEILGSPYPVPFTASDAGLSVPVPAEPPGGFVPVLKIAGKGIVKA